MLQKKQRMGQMSQVPASVDFIARSFPEAFSWICDGELNLSSSCVQRSIIDATNVLFLSAFYISWIFASTRERGINGSSTSTGRVGLVFVFVSVCCAFIGVAHFVVALCNLVSQTPSSWLSHPFEGLIWISLAVSLLTIKSKWLRILVTVWWVAFCILVTALNVRVLFEGLGIGVLDVVSWPVNFLLVFCAFQTHFLRVPEQNPKYDANLNEPLLASNPDKGQSPLSQASCLSKAVFYWINPLLRVGYLKTLEFEDIPSLVSEDEAELAYQKFAQAWDSLIREKRSHSVKNLVIKAIATVYCKENIYIGVCALLRTVAVIISPLLLYWFVEYSNRDDKNLSEGITIVGCLIVAKLVESFSQRHYFFNSRRSGMRMRSALMVAVYQKQLKLSSTARKRHSTGEIVNYIAVDAYRMGEFPWWFHVTWSLALQLFLSIGVLLAVMGIGALPGLVPVLMCGLLNLPFAKILQNCQSQFMIAQDERLRSTSEILNNMKIIKLQSWEEKFKSFIESRRETEMKWLAKAQYKRACGTLIYWMTPTIISSVIFLGCTVLDSTRLDASTIFTVLATMRAMAEPVRMIPESLSVLIQVMVSLDRINAFLVDDELKNDRILKFSSPYVSPNSTSIQISSGNFAWDIEPAILTLKGINLEVKCGQKIAVCGPVGAGKSSLLYAILGEITRTEGTVAVSGSIAYVSQTSWIQSGTIRDNILYGKPMDEARYEKAIKACALDKDIASFNHGDLTEIGQRGLNLSGGQKQRIQLARAVYNDADIYLLDDPFSAVDAHTAAILFNDCVMAALEKKTVVLVTHQVEFLTDVDRILLMEDGCIAQSGSYQELLTAGNAFEHLVNAHKEVLTTFGHSNSETANPITVEHEEETVKEHKRAEVSAKAPPGGAQLVEEEEREIGDVGLKAFWDYTTVSKGTTLLILGVLAQSAFVVLQAGSTYWLAFAIQYPDITSGVLIGVFSSISSFSTLFVYLRSLLSALLGLKASKAFFTGFTDSIFKAPMAFFDSTPVGRILTRASSDLSVVDFDIPFSILFVVAAGIELLTAIGIMASVTWQVLLVATFAMVATKYVQSYYLASARDLVRINGTTKAPVMNYATETSLGLATIRAFNMGDRFFGSFLKLVDADAKLFFHSNALMEWLVLRIETLQNLTLFTAAFLLILLPKGFVPPGLVGLSLSYAFNLSGTQVFVTRWYCYLANYMISVERIKQFMHIPSEPPAIIEEHRPPSSWPSRGRIELQELKLRYRPNAPLVLKGITCTFEEGHRVGVVGRTGSGKTTLISALFRLVEPAGGNIFIDGLDITSIGLKDLRMKLSIIPQEPTLFRGSVRTNIDPLGLHTDHEIWMALEKCQLKATISSLPNQLDSSVSDEGENWSAGQRQLFCLGRVLLRRNRILVLDEATASIDSATDAILQRVIRKEFSDCTVITVAHRVPTVIDSDMVMVLSYGNLVEYHKPSKLMEMNSHFSKLVAEYWSSCRRSYRQNFDNYQSLPHQ